MENPSIQEVLKELEKIAGSLTQNVENQFDTTFSEKIFQLEEKREDENLNGKNRRLWLVLADVYNEENYNQWFHLSNYLKMRKYEGVDLTLKFRRKCYPYIRNVALILYIRQVIFKESEESLKPLFDLAMKRYEDKANKINDAKFAKIMRG